MQANELSGAYSPSSFDLTVKIEGGIIKLKALS